MLRIIAIGLVAIAFFCAGVWLGFFAWYTLKL